MGARGDALARADAGLASGDATPAAMCSRTRVDNSPTLVTVREGAYALTPRGDAPAMAWWSRSARGVPAGDAVAPATAPRAT